MYVRVHVFPGSKSEKIISQKDTLLIYVREEAKMNQANRRVREIVAEHHGVELSAVQLLTGHRSTSKLFSIDIEEKS